MKKFVFLFSLLTASQTMDAQNFGEALRYSNYQYGSTTRSLSVGGSMSALGADFSALSTNPAGLAQYRGAEISLSFGVKNTSAQTQLLAGSNAPFTQSNINGTFNNFGIIFNVSNDNNATAWKSVKFGIGVNRIADLNKSVFITGSSKGSITQRWSNLANQGKIDDLEYDPAYYSGAIGQDNVTKVYWNDMDATPNALLKKTQSIENKGYINEMVLSYAGNYKDRVLMGMTLGIPFLNHSETKTYTETDENNVNPAFGKLVYNEYLQTDGVGVNAKFGLIFRVHPNLRLGIAVHTPTVFALKDTFLNSAEYTFTENKVTKTATGTSPSGNVDYKFQSPWRFLASACVLAGKNGFVTGEAEWVQFNGAKYAYPTASAEAQRAVNQAISDSLRQSMSLRMGGELVLDIFRIRAGAGMQMSPLANDKAVNWSYSAGIGIRTGYFFADLGYRNMGEAYRYQPYQHFENVQKVQTNLTYHQIMATLGFKF
ncbi:MAG: hypothetical protein RLZZ628_2041 [Bacteroidota bacterium]|jgi:hypothetical protein